MLRKNHKEFLDYIKKKELHDSSDTAAVEYIEAIIEKEVKHYAAIKDSCLRNSSAIAIQTFTLQVGDIYLTTMVACFSPLYKAVATRDNYCFRMQGDASWRWPTMRSAGIIPQLQHMGYPSVNLPTACMYFADFDLLSLVLLALGQNVFSLHISSYCLVWNMLHVASLLMSLYTSAYMTDVFMAPV